MERAYKDQDWFGEDDDVALKEAIQNWIDSGKTMTPEILQQMRRAQNAGKWWLKDSDDRALKGTRNSQGDFIPVSKDIDNVPQEDKKMARTDWMEDYIKRSTEYRNTAESGDSYEAPRDEDITTDTRYDNVTPDSKPYVANEFSDISELDTEHAKMNKLKKDRKYQKHLDLLKSQGTTPVLDMDMGKDSENQDEWMRLIGKDEDKRNQAGWKALFEKEEEEDDWWSKIKEALNFDFDFGGDGMLSGIDGGQDRNVRLSGKSPRDRRAIERGVTRKY